MSDVPVADEEPFEVVQLDLAFAIGKISLGDVANAYLTAAMALIRLGEVLTPEQHDAVLEACQPAILDTEQVVDEP